MFLPDDRWSSPTLQEPPQPATIRMIPADVTRHTWSHADFDTITLSTMITEINKNITWAKANELKLDPTEVVTGGHTGLSNPTLTAALAKTGVKTVAADASLPKWLNVQSLGPATVLPRHPTWLAYNAGTRAEQVDEFFAQNIGWAGGPADWSRYVDIATNDMLTSVLANDPRPFYFHQANLAEDANFFAVADALLARFHSWYSVGFTQPTMTEAQPC